MYGIVTVTAPTSAVDNLTTIPGIRSVQLSWLPPSDTDPAAIVESYNLTCIPQIADFVTIRRSYSQPGMHTIVGFSPATEYNCSIVASNNAGYGPSTMVNVITMDECKMRITNPACIFKPVFKKYAVKPFQLKLTGIQSCIEWVVG